MAENSYKCTAEKITAADLRYLRIDGIVNYASKNKTTNAWNIVMGLNKDIRRKLLSKVFTLMCQDIEDSLIETGLYKLDTYCSLVVVSHDERRRRNLRKYFGQTWRNAVTFRSRNRNRAFKYRAVIKMRGTMKDRLDEQTYVKRRRYGI